MLDPPVLLGTPAPLLLLLLALLPVMLGISGGRLVVTAIPEGFHCAAANRDTELACAGCLRRVDVRRPRIGLSITAGLLGWPVIGLRRVKALPALIEWLRGCLAGGTTTEPSAAGAAAPLRDLTRFREAPRRARTGLMARYDRRAPLPVEAAGGLPGGGVTISCGARQQQATWRMGSVAHRGVLAVLSRPWVARLRSTLKVIKRLHC